MKARTLRTKHDDDYEQKKAYLGEELLKLLNASLILLEGLRELDLIAHPVMDL